MEKQIFKRHESYKRNNARVTDQGDNIKVMMKLNAVDQKNPSTLIEADRGDNKIKHNLFKEVNNTKKAKDGSKSVVNNKNNRDTPQFEGNLELNAVKPVTTHEIKVADNVDHNKKTVCIEDETKLNDSKIKPLYDMMRQNTKMDAAERKRIREKYTIRNSNYNVHGVTPNHCPPKQNESSKGICSKREHLQDLGDNKSESGKVLNSSDVNKSLKTIRKPVITTVRSNKDTTKVYKTVTFTDNESANRKPQSIQIKIPTDELVKNKDLVALKKKIVCDKATEASYSSSGTGKSSNRKKQLLKSKRGPSRSPEVVISESPPTEVAKWAPNCIDKLNKPYYEAWVDTTLAAISKYSKDDKIFIEKQNLLESFKRMLERPESPDLVYDHLDEKYLGKIKIRQRQCRCK